MDDNMLLEQDKITKNLLDCIFHPPDLIILESQRSQYKSSYR